MLFIFISHFLLPGLRRWRAGVLARCCPPPPRAGRRAQLRAACQGASASVSEFTVVVSAPAYACERARAFPNNLANFLSFSLFSATLIGGSFDGSLELFVVGGEFSVSGISIFSSILGLESSFPGVGADFFFLNLAKVNF